MRKSLGDEFLDALDRPFLLPIRIAAFALFVLIAFGIFFALLNGAG